MCAVATPLNQLSLIWSCDLYRKNDTFHIFFIFQLYVSYNKSEFTSLNKVNDVHISRFPQLAHGIDLF